jgi:oligoendopeptidase F
MDFSLTDFTLQSYTDIAPYYEDLLQRVCTKKEDTLQWIADYDHLDAIITEDVTWRYIHHTCDTKNEVYEKAYMTFLMDISPKIQEVSDALNKKIVALPAIDEITGEDQAYAIWHKGIKQAIDMFREENIPLNTRDADLAKQYGEISAAMSVEYDGKTMTLQQAATYVELPERAVRKEVYVKIWERRLADAVRIDALMDEMVQLRDQMARNAGYPNFAAYAWDARGRFDYTQQHVFDFHK